VATDITQVTVLSIVVLACYVASAAWLASSMRRAQSGSHVAGVGMGVLALSFHGAKLWQDLSGTDARLSLGGTASIIWWVIALVAVVGAMRRPRFAIISAVLLAIAGVIAAFADDTVRELATKQSGWELTAHVVLSTLAYALLTVGAALAVAQALLDRRLRMRKPLGLLAALPSIESLESGMFQAIGAGFALLSLALFSGFVFVDNFLAQHLVHKAVLSCLAWVVFAVLLAGRAYLGWRGRTALRWTLGGFVLLGLAYFGTKLVLEGILGRHWG
jgi:ABC-type uncharacterized transport system permease subunit